MNIRKALIALIVIAFLSGGYGYYLQTRRASQPTPSEGVPLIGLENKRAIQFPTSTPHVSGPTTPPPSNVVLPKPVTSPSGIRGSIVIGPTCPVQRIPPDPQCEDKPYATTLVAKNSNGIVVKTFSSDAHGIFKVVLPPGNYSVGPAASASVLPRAGFQDVVVRQGSFADVTIQFDSGIR